jgi:hypothetical protein
LGTVRRRDAKSTHLGFFLMDFNVSKNKIPNFFAFVSHPPGVHGAPSTSTKTTIKLINNHITNHNTPLMICLPTTPSGFL